VAGDWVVVGVESEAVWVKQNTTIEFRSRELLLRPPLDRDTFPDVAVRQAVGESYDATATFVHRFLSVIVWRRKAYIRVVGHTGGTHPTRVGGRKEPVGLRFTLHPGYDPADLPTPPTPSQDLALALYREALGLVDDTYKFLGLFRILNITLRTSGDQIRWVNGHLGDLVGYPVERCHAITAKGEPDIGAYLYRAGRSALAHAAVPPVVDPDIMEDTHRINLDMPLLTALVELYMERELALPGY
jgi:hypothetical protein